MSWSRNVLPYLPHKIKPENLHSNGKLLDNETIKEIERRLADTSDEQINEYIKTRLNYNEFGRYSKKLFNIPYGIIKGKTGTYAIYNEKNLPFEACPAGGYGKIKFAQHLGTGEYEILKIQVLTDSFHTQVFLNEHEKLTTVEMTKEPLMLRKRKNSPQVKGYLLMEYIKGVDLSFLTEDRLNKDHPLSHAPDLFWLQMTVQIIRALWELVRKKRILHRDLKFENVMYDIARNQAYIIDYGHSHGVEQKSPPLKFLGLPGHNAPENFIHLFSQDQIYTEKSEVFALSTLLQEILFHQTEKAYLEKTNNQPQVLYYQPPDFISRGKDTIFAKDSAIVNYLQKMRSPFPRHRPTLDEVLTFFTATWVSYSRDPLYAKDLREVEHIRTQALEADNRRLKQAETKITKSAPHCPFAFFQRLFGWGKKKSAKHPPVLEAKHRSGF